MRFPSTNIIVVTINKIINSQDIVNSMTGCEPEELVNIIIVWYLLNSIIFSRKSPWTRFY